MVKVNPEILVWARRSAGISEEDAASKLNIKPDRLKAFESGERLPTRRQLEKMSGHYHKPLVVFYMPSIPKKSDNGADFRTLKKGTSPLSEARLEALLVDVRARQEMVRAAIEESEEDFPLSYAGSVSVSDGPDKLFGSMQKVLDFDRDEFRKKPGPREAFAWLRSVAEQAGVFVVLMGNLGSHHTQISSSMFRGFALYDKIAPFVVINEYDSRAAWSFTLLHELAHVFLGETGISSYEGEHVVEKLCNSVASRFLLDPAELQETDWPLKKIEDLAGRIEDFANERNLSRRMVAYNLLASGIIDGKGYGKLNKEFGKAWEEKGWAPYLKLKRQRMGGKLVSFAGRMLGEGILSVTKAGAILGVRPTYVRQLLDS